MHFRKTVYISRIHFRSFNCILLLKINFLTFIWLFLKCIPLSDTWESPKQPNSNNLKLTIKESTVFWCPLYYRINTLTLEWMTILVYTLSGFDPKLLFEKRKTSVRPMNVSQGVPSVRATESLFKNKVPFYREGIV